MEYRRLGQSDLQVSVLSLGILSLAGGGSWGPQDEKESIRTIEMAYDAGVNFYDSAESYSDGYSEALLGRVFKNRRSEVLLASKVSATNLKAEDVMRSCEATLQRLGTDYLDLYYIHWPNPDIPIAETMGALTQLREAGKIRVAGCSNFGRRDMEKLLACGRVEANQLPYSLLWRAIEFEIAQYCCQNQVSITCYSPLAQGLLTGKYTASSQVPDVRARNRLFCSRRTMTEHGGAGMEEEMFAAISALAQLCKGWGVSMTQAVLRWTLAQKAIGSVIVGCRTSQQLRESLSALDVDLRGEEIEKIGALTETIKQSLGPNPDMWRTGGESRYDCLP